MIPYGKQTISEEDIEAVVDVLRSDWLTQGPAITMFEKKIMDYCGSEFAIAVSNATSALHLSCMALGLTEGDALWTSPNSFVASANCARYCGASVDFIDIDQDTYNISINALKEKLEEAKKRGRLPKIVVPVHFAGQSCDMKSIKELSREYGFYIIEDASHAIGGKYDSSLIGSCEYSDITVFSFHPVKIITTGEGGVVTTNNQEIAEKICRLRSHGITRDESKMIGATHGSFYYQQIELGYNYRMTDIQAALGVSQLNSLDFFVKRRNEIANIYNNELASHGIVIPYQSPSCLSSFHLYVVLLPFSSLMEKNRIINYMRNSGVGVNVHYIPIHTQPYYKSLGFNEGDFPISENYYLRTISLPIYPGLTYGEQEHVIKIIKSAISSIN